MIFRFLFIATLLFQFISQNLFSQTTLEKNIGDKWDILDEKIVNSTIDKDDALDLLEIYEIKIKKYFKQNNGISVDRKDWVFPLKNFTSFYYRDSSKDYREDDYDYFQGSNTKGHPAHDIMILDVNKDLLDDSTLKPVDVVSMSSGVVVATDTTWAVGSTLRGGKYVKVFDVTNNGIFYYSHLSKVHVKPGDILDAGDKIGEVGRTGRKAIDPKGKTHVHVAYLVSDDGYPLPEDIIKDLKRAEKNLNKK